jgi:hypothetical protein
MSLLRLVLLAALAVQAFAAPAAPVPTGEGGIGVGADGKRTRKSARSQTVSNSFDPIQCSKAAL